MAGGGSVQREGGGEAVKVPVVWGLAEEAFLIATFVYFFPFWQELAQLTSPAVGIDP